MIAVRRSGILFPALMLGIACARKPPVVDGTPVAPASQGAYSPLSTTRQAPLAARTAPVTAPVDLDHLTLDRIVDISLANNPVTRVSWASALAAADEYGASRGEYYPTVTANVGATQALSAATSTRPAETRTQFGPTASLSYLVLDFGGRAGRVDVSRRLAVAAGFTHNVTIQNTILATESAVYNFLGTRALRDAQRAAVAEATANLKAAQDRREVGLATIADELQAQTALSQAELDLETLDGQLDISRGVVAVAMGLPATSAIDIPDVAPLDSVEMTSMTVDSLIRVAEESRPDFAAARSQVLAASAATRVARSANRPALALGTTAGLTGANGAGSSGGNYTLNIGIQLPVFTGFSNEYRVQAADADLIAAQARADVSRQQVILQVLTAHTGLQTATRRVRTAAELLRSALQSEEVARGRYREGVGTIVDLLVAQAALASARAQSVQTQWQWRQALAQLSHDVGTLGIHGEPRLTNDTTTHR